MTNDEKAALLDIIQNCAFSTADAESYYNALDAAFPSAGNTDGLSTAVKNALLAIFQKAAYSTDDGQTYYDALYSAFFPPANLVSITATFTQGQAVIYDTDSLDTLRQYLVVQANYDDMTVETVTTYTLSGTLTAGTSTITVAYGGKTDTFTVTVTQRIQDTTAQIASSGKILTHHSYPPNYRESDATNGAITIKYTMPSVTSILYPAGIIPTDAVASMVASGYAASLVIYDDNDNPVSYVNELTTSAFNRWVQNVNAPMREYEQSWTLSGQTYTKIAFSVDMRYIDEAYMYDKTTGKIWFAGSKTPYYGYSNVADLTGIPAAYQQVQYLESTQTDTNNGAFVDTGLSFSDPTSVEFDIEFEPKAVASSWTQAQCIVGSLSTDATTNSQKIGVEISFVDPSNGVLMWSGAPGAASVPSTWYATHNAVGTWSSTAVTLKLDNGEVVTSTQTTRGCSGRYIGLFGCPALTGSAYKGAMLLYNGRVSYAKIKQDGSLIADLVPVRRVSDDKLGVYDLVRKVFCSVRVAGNNGAVSAITAGADVTGV